MPRGKKSKPHNADINGVLDAYSAEHSLAALNTLETSTAWDMFKTFIYYNAAVHGTMSNVLIQQDGKTLAACASGAKAEVLREVVDQFMDLLKRKVVGDTGLVEDTRPTIEV